MQPRSLEQRVTSLEQQVQKLRELSPRVSAVELQILQLREEMRVRISAVRDEVRAAGDGTQRLARTLHEELLSRLALAREGDDR